MVHEEFQIKKATETDKSELVRLFYESFHYYRSHSAFSVEAAPFEAVKDERKYMETGFTQYLDEYSVFVAYHSDQAIGYISGYLDIDTFFELGREGYIEDWYVSPDFQGKGVGKELFETLVKEFKKSHATHIGLDTYWGFTEALDRYEKMGFVKHSINLKMKI